jgi:hypothetical protein
VNSVAAVLVGVMCFCVVGAVAFFAFFYESACERKMRRERRALLIWFEEEGRVPARIYRDESNSAVASWDTTYGEAILWRDGHVSLHSESGCSVCGFAGDIPGLLVQRELHRAARRSLEKEVKA